MKLPYPIAGIILSAGASRRMGTPKALLTLNGETFLDRLIRLFSGVVNPVIVVLGDQADQIRSGIQRGSEANFVRNPDPERGMLSSLQCGLAALPAEVKAVMFTPVDHPNLESSTVENMVIRSKDGASVVVPEYQGAHGHPVLISRALVAELLALPATAQASDVIHRYRSQTAYIAVDDAAVTIDIDDRAAYAELLARQS